MLQILFLTVFLTLSSAGNVTFTDCANHELLSVESSVCSGSNCSVTVGTTITTTATFVANKDSNKAVLTMTAQVGDIVVVIPVPESDVCKAITPACPLKKGQTYSAKITQTVSLLPKGAHAIITGTITGDNGVLTCSKTVLDIAANRFDHVGAHIETIQ